MIFQVPEDIIKKSSKCKHCFACLHSGTGTGRPRCEVEYRVGDNFLFIKTENVGPCPYRFPLGYAQVCSCPLHCAINLLETETPPEAEGW